MYNLNDIVPYEIARSIAECYCAAVILKCTFCVFFSNDFKVCFLRFLIKSVQFKKRQRGNVF